MEKIVLDSLLGEGLEGLRQKQERLGKEGQQRTGEEPGGKRIEDAVPVPSYFLFDPLFWACHLTAQAIIKVSTPVQLPQRAHARKVFKDRSCSCSAGFEKN